jgi:hypothetical protein
MPAPPLMIYFRKRSIVSQRDALTPLLECKDFKGRILAAFCHTRETARLALAVFVPISRAM